MAAARFPTTRRSVVLALGSADATERARAFDTLTAIYWKPLYKYARVAWNRTREDAEDLTQGFFARLYEKDSLASYDRDKGGFRPFLRTLFDRYSANENKARQRIKRGGGEIHVDFDAAERRSGATAPGRAHRTITSSANGHAACSLWPSSASRVVLGTRPPPSFRDLRSLRSR